MIVLSIWSICGDGGEDNVGHGDHNGCKAVAAEAAAGEDLGGDSVDFVNWMILIMVKIILMIREDDSGDDFDKHDSDNPVDQCDKDCFDHNNAYL